ncbi:MAG: hypothetical protein RL215_2853 [Planctomycetota bacterium]
MSFSEAAADGESQSAASGGSTASGIDAVEAFEDMWQVFGGDAAAVVVDDELSGSGLNEDFD